MTLAEARNILKVGLYATKEEIKKAWRARAMETHPDRNGNVNEFKKVQEAYTKLTQDTTITNTIETEIFETIFADLMTNKEFAKKIEEWEKTIPEESTEKTVTTPMETPIRVRKPKYPICTRKGKKP